VAGAAPAAGTIAADVVTTKVKVSPAAASRESLGQAWPGAGGASQAVVDVDTVGVDSKGGELSRWAVRSWLVVETRA
jgi:hypothetical protein